MTSTEFLHTGGTENVLGFYYNKRHILLSDIILSGSLCICVLVCKYLQFYILHCSNQQDFYLSDSNGYKEDQVQS